MSASESPGASLTRRARSRFACGDLAGAAELLLLAADAYAAEGNVAKATWALGSAGYACFAAGDTARGLSLLKRAAAAGYDDLEKIDSLGALPLDGRLAAAQPAFVRLRARVQSNAGPIVAEAWQNQAIGSWQWMTFCRERDLARLRVLVPQPVQDDDIATFRQSLAWVREQFEHDPEYKASRADPITILREARDGRRFTCQEFALLLAAVLQCHGHPARVIAALRDNYHRGSGKGHWLTEAWSDTMGKWIVLDPQNSCVWRRGRDLLNGAELRCALATGAVRDIVAVVNGRRKSRLVPWLEHFRTIWYYHNQDYFADWDALSAVEELGDTPQVAFQGRRRAFIASHPDPRDLYPAMQRIRFRVQPGRRSLSFVLENSYPFFTFYEISVNGSPWSRCTRTPRVALPGGRVQVRFRMGGRQPSPSEEVGLTVLRTGGDDRMALQRRDPLLAAGMSRAGRDHDRIVRSR